jgi:hypothetical protein
MFGKVLISVLALAVAANADPRIRFVFYHGPTLTDTTTYTVDNFQQIINHASFIRTRNSLMFHFGSGQSVVTPQVNDVIQSYFNRNTHNFIVVNYDDTAVINTDEANSLALGITTSNIRLFDNGYNSGSMTFLGYGLGAQIMARASRQVQGQTGRRHIIGRLTGLEPETLGPINGITIGRLSSADAQFVESIHTDGNGQRGDLESNGHVSFFVNGGVNQPQCNQVSPIARWDCNSLHALTYWAEAARSAVPIFPSLSCDSWEAFTGGQCNNNPQANMGRATEANNRGPYMLRTNLSAPFSRNTALP